MPLRALLNGSIVHSFKYNLTDWLELKSSSDKAYLKMPCCDRKAIPKTSKLGTQYFAHAKRGECTSAPESHHHLYLKSLVANIAVQNGWDVITEHPGETPQGERWTADVFCQKGSAKLAIEIQWSHQTLDEYKRRTKKYADSGVRCLWLFKMRSNNMFHLSDYEESKELPYYGFSNFEDLYYVERYNEKIEEFIKGVLTNKLAWLPNYQKSITIEIQADKVKCFNCKKNSTLISEINIYNCGYKLQSTSYIDEELLIWLSNIIPRHILTEHGIGEIKRHFISRAPQGKELALIEEYSSGSWVGIREDGQHVPMTEYECKSLVRKKLNREYGFDKEIVVGCIFCKKPLEQEIGTPTISNYIAIPLDTNKKLPFHLRLKKGWYYNGDLTRSRH